MGCRTGLYLVVAGECGARDVLPFVRGMMEWIGAFEGAVPGASPAECGNWSDQNPAMAAWEARKYLSEVLLDPKPENLEYPA
jgi:S-ribosylhomocysteine lyase